MSGSTRLRKRIPQLALILVLTQKQFIQGKRILVIALFLFYFTDTCTIHLLNACNPVLNTLYCYYNTSLEDYHVTEVYCTPRVW